MKNLYILLLVVAILFSFCSCSNVEKDNNTTTTTTETTTEETTSKTFIPYDNNETTNSNSTSSVVTTQYDANVTTSTTKSNSATESDSKTVTYYSENPNNKYISAVVNKYGVDASCLVALIRTNSKKPGATVLQFTGERDSSGNLIKTEKALKYVYDVSDSGMIKKSSGQKTDNDGCTYAESYVNYNLAVKYLVPQLDEMKKERTYENYFSN